jgi:hypothetical protein
MPNQIQNWDMAYAMTFEVVNNKLQRDFKADETTRNTIRKAFASVLSVEIKDKSKIFSESHLPTIIIAAPAGGEDTAKATAELDSSIFIKEIKISSEFTKAPSLIIDTIELTTVTATPVAYKITKIDVTKESAYNIGTVLSVTIKGGDSEESDKTATASVGANGDITITFDKEKIYKRFPTITIDTPENKVTAELHCIIEKINIINFGNGYLNTPKSEIESKIKIDDKSIEGSTLKVNYGKRLKSITTAQGSGYDVLNAPKVIIKDGVTGAEDDTILCARFLVAAPTNNDGIKTALNDALKKVVEKLLNSTNQSPEESIPNEKDTVLDFFKRAVGTVFESHLLAATGYIADKAWANNYRNQTDKTIEKAYLRAIVEMQVQNAILAENKPIANKLYSNVSAVADLNDIPALIDAALTAICPQNSCPTLFSQYQANNMIYTSNKAWSFAPNGNDNWVKIKIPVNRGYYSFNLIPETKVNFEAIILLDLTWIKEARQKLFKSKTFVDVTKDEINNYVKYIEVEGNTESNAQEKKLFLSIINNLTNTSDTPSSTSQSFLGYVYNSLFDSLNIFQALAAQQPTVFKWMYPTTIAYATINSNDLEPKSADSVFGILCMTKDRTNKEKPAIDINLIPKGNGTAIILTPTLLMKNIVKPKVMALFCTDTNKTTRAIDTDFEDITPTSFENKKDLYLIEAVKNEADQTSNPVIVKNTLSIAIDNNSLVLNFGEMRYNWNDNENFKVTLQHKMKGDFRKLESGWIAMKQDSSTVTPDVTPQHQIHPNLQKAFDWSATAVVTFVASELFEVRAKKYFIEDATNRISSIYHNHVTNDMDALQNLLYKKNEAENKKFIADLKKHKQSILDKGNHESTYLKKSEPGFTVKDTLYDFLKVQIYESKKMTEFSLKIITAKSEYDNGGMILINHDCTKETNIKTVSKLEDKQKWLNEYRKWLLPLRLSLKKRFAELAQQSVAASQIADASISPSPNNSKLTLQQDNILSNEASLHFLNVAIGTTTHETAEFIEQLYNDNMNLNNAILETKKEKVEVILVYNIMEDTEKVVYLILQMDIGFVLLKTNSEKNEYGGFECINYYTQQELPIKWLVVKAVEKVMNVQSIENQELANILRWLSEELETQMKQPLLTNLQSYLINLQTFQNKSQKTGFLSQTQNSGQITQTISNKPNLIKRLNVLKQNEVTVTAPMIDRWMETNKELLQEIRYALTLIIYKESVFEEFTTELKSNFKLSQPLKFSKWWFEKLKVGNLVLEKEFIDITNTEVRIALKGVNYWYPYLGLKLCSKNVKLYGVNQEQLKKTSDWTEITISDFEELYPDSVRQIVNELKRVAFPKYVNTERREFWIDFLKDTVAGTTPIIVSKLSEWWPPEDPTSDITSSGKIKEMEKVIDNELQKIEWPGSQNQGLKLQEMNLDGNFRLSFRVPITINEAEKYQLISKIADYKADRQLDLINTGDIPLTFCLAKEDNNPPITNTNIIIVEAKKNHLCKMKDFKATGADTTLYLYVMATKKHDLNPKAPDMPVNVSCIVTIFE